MSRENENSATRILRNAAREGVAIQTDRARLLTRLVSRNELANELPSHLTRRLLMLRPGWQVLSFSDRDWPALEAARDANQAAQQNMLWLLVRYILTNSARVHRLQNLASAYSDGISGINPRRTDGLLDELDPIDLQSLLILKLQGVLKQANYAEFVDYVRGRDNSNWLRTRFVYPLVYHQLNTPADSYMDTFLSYMFPQDDSGGLERGVVRHLLRDDLDIHAPIGYRAYIALASHPYDALESLTNFCEAEFLNQSRLGAETAAAMALLAEEFPQSRLSQLFRYIQTWQSPANSWRSGLVPSAASHSWPSEVSGLLAAFVDADSSNARHRQPSI